MFEPLNALERALMAAATDPGARPAFTQRLLESTLYISPAGELGPDGNGGSLVVVHLKDGAGDAADVFTAAERVQEVVGADARVLARPGRELLEQLSGRPVQLNPNLAYGVVWSAADIDAILGRPHSEVVAKDEKILLGHPAERPEALIQALAQALGVRPEVKGAWLLLAHRASEPEPTWLLGVDHDGDWEPISRVIGEVVSHTDLGGKTISATPLNDNTLGPRLRGGIPVVAPRATARKKRGLFDFLKG